MLFNLFKKKKDNETDVGGVKIKTGAAAQSAQNLNRLKTNTGLQNPSSINYSGNKIGNPNVSLRMTGGIETNLLKRPTPTTSLQGGQNVQQISSNKPLSSLNASGVPRPQAPEFTPQHDRPIGPQNRPQLPQDPKFDPMAGYQKLAQDRQALLDQQKQQGENYLNEAYGERQRYLQDYIPRLQQQFAQAKTGVEEGIGLAEGDAAMARDRAEDDWGTSQRQAAMTRRESEARTAGHFANLNSADSYGFGSHGQAQENVESDFNRFTQEGIKQKQQNFHEIERALQDYTLGARQQINQMESSLNEAVMQIESDLNMNDIEKRNAISKLATDYKDGVLAIQENLQNIQYQYQMAQEELKKTQLSPTFMQTGVPQNENDYMFYMKNYDQYKDMIGGGDSKSREELQHKGDVINMIDNILSRDTAPLTGQISLQGGINPWKRQEVTDTKAQIQHLRSLLELAAAGRMKGQGAITENERKILEESVISLAETERGTFRVSDQELRRQLNAARQILERSGAVSTGVYNQNINPNQFGS